MSYSTVPDRVYAYLQMALQDALDRMQANLDTMTDENGNRRIATGAMNRSLDESPVRREGMETVVEFFLSEYWRYIDQGVRGVGPGRQLAPNSPYIQKTPPPYAKRSSPIRKWMRQRGIVPRNAAGKRNDRSKNKDSNEARRKRLARAIALKMHREGIEPIPFYSTVINPAWEKKLLEGIEIVKDESAEEDFDKIMERMVAELRATGTKANYKR